MYKNRTLPAWLAAVSRKQNEEKDERHAAEDAVKNLMPVLNFSGSIIYSYHLGDCCLLCDEIVARWSAKGEIHVGFDMEWPVTYQPRQPGRTALIQICPAQTHCYLFHVACLRGIPSGLKKLLMSDKVMKIGLNIASDFWKLERDYDLKAKSVIETSVIDLSELANQKLQFKENWSLENLVSHVLKHRLEKRSDVRMSNWAQFPLSEHQKIYAANDAYACYELFQVLKLAE